MYFSSFYLAYCLRHSCFVAVLFAGRGLFIEGSPILLHFLFYRNFGHYKRTQYIVTLHINMIFITNAYFYLHHCVVIFISSTYFVTIKIFKSLPDWLNKKKSAIISFIYKHLLVEKRNVWHPDFVRDKLYPRYSSKVIRVPYKEFISPRL